MMLKLNHLAGFGEPGGFQLDDIPGLIMRLKSRNVGLSDDSAVSTCPDSTGHGNNATQSGGNRPVLKTNILPNGLPVIRFAAGSAQYFNLPNFSALTQGEIFVVLKINADPPSDTAHTGLWAMSTAVPINDNTHFPYDGDSNIYDTWGTDTRKTVGNPIPSLAAWNVYNVYSAANDWAAYLNNTSLFSTGTNTVGFNAAPTFGKSVGAYYLDGDVADIALFNRKLTTGERTDAYNSLKSEYGL